MNANADADADADANADADADADANANADADADANVSLFRTTYRAREIGPHYSGWLHFAFTSLGSLSAIGFALSRVADPTALEWLTVPATFVVANFGEYFGHRGPMHHRRRGLGLLFQRHTLQHHRFFTADAMTCESTRDFQMVLFPPVMLLFFLGALAAPIGLGLFALFGSNVGWLFVATAVAYFLSYEWLHFAYHQPPSSAIGRLPGLAALRRHHAVHHDPRRMRRWNFNITFPIADRVLGTQWPDG